MITFIPNANKIAYPAIIMKAILAGIGSSLKAAIMASKAKNMKSRFMSFYHIMALNKILKIKDNYNIFIFIYNAMRKPWLVNIRLVFLEYEVILWLIKFVGG